MKYLKMLMLLIELHNVKKFEIADFTGATQRTVIRWTKPGSTCIPQRKYRKKIVEMYNKESADTCL